MELETINKLYLELSQVATAKTAREAALEHELDALRKDAARYRWLRDNEASAGTGMTDAEIDAAIAGEKK